MQGKLVKLVEGPIICDEGRLNLGGLHCNRLESKFQMIGTGFQGDQNYIPSD